MKQDDKNKNHYIAADGKVFQRVFNGFEEIKTPTICGSELFLGKILIDAKGNKLADPIDDKIEYYVEVDKPTEEENSNKYGRLQQENL